VTDVDLDLAGIEEAAQVVDPALRGSPKFVNDALRWGAAGHQRASRLAAARIRWSSHGRPMSLTASGMPLASDPAGVGRGAVVVEPGDRVGLLVQPS